MTSIESPAQTINDDGRAGVSKSGIHKVGCPMALSIDTGPLMNSIDRDEG
jgi:hypothetical protein